MLSGKNIILGVCGGIAAYKAAYLIRLLKKEETETKVVVTPSAKNFITPLTLSALSKNPVYSEFFNPETGEWINHVDLANWADLILITPTSANTIAKMTHGICNNLLLAIYMSATSLIYLTPAMDRDMYNHPANQNNLSILRERGHRIIEPEEGSLASGLEGMGRMAEPEAILNILKQESQV